MACFWCFGKQSADSRLAERYGAIDFERVDDGHDDGVNRGVFRERGLAGGRAGGDENQVAGAGVDGINGHIGFADGRAMLIGLADDQELAPDKLLVLDRGYGGTYDPPDLHAASDRSDFPAAPPTPTAPAGAQN